MIEHLPVLQIVVPLLGAPICLVLRARGISMVFAVAVAWASFAIALSMLSVVSVQGELVYALGGWAAPIGIEYRIDLLNAFVITVVTGIGAVVLPIGPGIHGHTVSESREYLYHAAFLLCMAGLLGVAATGDIFNVFVFLEISSLAAYTLVALGNRRRALRAAFSYLVMGTIGGTFILIGIGFLYQMTGTLNMADLARLLPAVHDNRAVHAAFAFLLVGVGIKLAVFPLHQWLPNAYTFAPPAVSAFLAATATKVAYYLLIRLVFTVFGVGFVFGALGIGPLLQVISLVAMFVGALAAINQTDLKRLLAYSSVSQIGYMTLGLSFGSVAGLTGGLVHIANHALMKGGMFLAVACIVARTGTSAIADLRGLGRRMPLTMAAFAVGGLGLIGVPLTVGFVSKWYLVLAAIEADQMLLGFAILVSSLLAAVYVWRVVEVAWFQEPLQSTPEGEAPLRLLIPTWLLIGASLYFGVATEMTGGIAGRVAAQLLGVAP
jgi:multicomponent Na+:H+ antiporter subunit D